MGKEQEDYSFLKELAESRSEQKPKFSNYTSYLARKAREKGVPVLGQFELTPLCNFRCGMCYVQLTETQLDQPVLTAEQWNSLISKACKAGMINATLTGGECLAYPGFKAVYEHLQNLGCEVEVFTNGALLDDRWIEYFQSHPPAGIQITLYGDSEDAYERVTGQRAFEKVLNHARSVREAKLPLTVSVTPCRPLGEDVFGTVRLARELTADVRINPQLSIPRQETGRADSCIDPDEDYYIRIMKYQHELEGITPKAISAESLPEEGGPERERILCGVKCGAGRSGFNITWQGVMIPCNELDMIRAYPFKTGFDQAWRQINQAVEQWPRSSACEGCAYETVCIRCIGQVLRYAEPGKWPRSLCERTKRFVQQGVYQMPDCE